MNRCLLKLYVTGKTPKSERAILNLQRLCKERLEGKYQIKVIDVLENPEVAENEKIIATPALIRELPPPIRSIIGDLSDIEKVLYGLDLKTSAELDYKEEFDNA
jgi:circadian clock protein KaiB